MTSKQRVLATIKGEPVDKVPVHHIQFSGHSASVILGRPNVCVGGGHVQWLEINALWESEDAHRAFEQRCTDDAIDLAMALGHDIIRTGYWRWGGRERPAKKLDERTFLFGDPGGDWMTVGYDPEIELLTVKHGKAGGPAQAASHNDPRAELTEDELRRDVEAEEEAARSHVPRTQADASLKATIEKYPGHIIRHGGGTVMIDMGSVRELMAVATWPGLIARRLMARAKRIAMDVPAMAAAGVEVNISGMDFCSRQGPCISPELFRDVVTPALKVIVDATHEHGMSYFYTSDGNFWPVAEQMFDAAGIDGWMETDKSAGMDLRLLRERFPRATIVGNIQSQVLHHGSKGDVVSEVMDCMDVAHELGGVIVGCSNLIMPGTLPGNIIAMMETIEKNR